MSNDLFYSAMEADDAYEQAIKAQFGKDSSRWDHPQSAYNAATQAAFELKQSTDEAWLSPQSTDQNQ